MTKAKLRTKTGCFTCRKRRVKCNEERPWCINCSIRGLECKWPLAPDLYDRRHRRSMNLTQTSASSEEADESQTGTSMQLIHIQRHALPFHPSTIPRDLIIAPTFRSDIEATLYQHFCDKFLSTVLTPNAHPGFFRGYLNYCSDLSIQYDSVRFSMLACSALNKHMLTNDPSYREKSLIYYSRAVKQVNKLLETVDWAHESPGDAIIISIIWLYIHSLWGLDTTEDAHKHVRGAVQMMNLRYSRRPTALSMASPSDRVTTESVLYQSFLLAIRHPFTVDFAVDQEFLHQTENILESMTYMDASPSANSPVLGLPLQFYRLILSVVHFCSSSTIRDMEASLKMKNEMIRWESAVNEIKIDYSVPSLTEDDLHSVTITLYILAASLLLDLVLDLPRGCVMNSSNLPRSTGRWQLRRGMEILQYPVVQEQWTWCFLGPWPLHILGYAADCQEDTLVVRKNLQNMRERIGYGEIERIIKELESVWEEQSRSSDLMEHAELSAICSQDC